MSLFDASLRLVPPDWRDAVARDLAEEARIRARGRWWMVAQAIRVSARLRFANRGELMWTDARHAVRSLAAARWFSLGAALTFMLGIGVNLAIFAAIDRLLFRSLPYGAPQDLVSLRVVNPQTGRAAGSFPGAISYRLSTASSTFAGLTVVGDPATAALTRGSLTSEDRLSLLNVSPNILRVLQVSPFIGRDILDEEARGRASVCWISYDAWRGRFGSDPAIVGRQLWIGNVATTVIGVLPAGFVPPSASAPSTDWHGLVAAYSGWAAIGQTGRTLVPFGRLAPGATLAAARAEAGAVAATLTSATAPEPVQVDTLNDVMFATYRPYLWLVASAAGLVLLMACANLASLFLARGRSRRHTAAICSALGASHGRLMSAAIAESLLTCAAGTGLAILTLAFAQSALHLVVPPVFSQYSANLTDGRVVAFAIIATTASAVLAAILPGWHMARVDVVSLLQTSGRSGRRDRTRSALALLVAESALATLLVLGASLALRSFVTLASDDLGFQPSNLYRVSLSGFNGLPPDQQVGRVTSSLDVIRLLPGVQVASAGDHAPGTFEAPMRGFTWQQSRGALVQVTAGYFETLGTPVLAGRPFTQEEIAQRADVVVVDRRAAALVWPALTPGQVVGQLWQPDGRSRLVVGVTESIKVAYGRDPSATAFIPLGAASSTWANRVLIRMRPGQSLSDRDVATALSARIGETSATVRPVAPAMDVNLRDPRFRAVLLSILALTALLVAAVGLYAVTSFDVAQRRYEIGVRMSLGARPRAITRLVLRQTCLPVAAGAVLALIGGWWLAQFAQSLLYNTSARDAATYVTAVCVLLATAATAAWRPARRAAQTDPVKVLRAQ